MQARAKLSKQVQVEAPARLHLGFIDLCGALGRQFGSLGLTVSGISTRLSIIVGDHPEFRAAGAEQERVTRYAAQLARHFGVKEKFSVRVDEFIPGHAGLGSGTQLALAVGRAMSALFELDMATAEIATVTARGARSGVGIGVFDSGGFIVDLGRGKNTVVPPVLTRLDFPDDWGVILVRDENYVGISGDDEKNAFFAMEPMQGSLAQALSHHILMGIIPAIMEHDFCRFCASLAFVQETIGEYFAPFQGGQRFTSPTVAATAAAMKASWPEVAIGQTSWGPTGFVFCPSLELMQEILDSRLVSVNPDGLLFSGHHGRNHGAKVVICEADTR